MSVAAHEHAIRVAVLLAFAAAVFALNVAAGLADDRYRTLFDPVYRWRQSLIVALSRMADVPARGYLGHGSIARFFNTHGLALMDFENDNLPSSEDRRRLMLDGDRLDGLLQGAQAVTVDPALPPVLIRGSEKGYADFMELAFRLFGVHVSSLYAFYFLLLLLACLAYAVEFRDSPFLLLALALYLAGHYAMVQYAHDAGPQLRAVHNSRFFPVLSLLPSAHVLALVLTGRGPRPGRVALAGAQCGLIVFVTWCRLEAAWQAGAVLAAGTVALVLAWVGRPSSGPATHRPGWWPLAMLTAALLVLSVYPRVALDARYRSESPTHVVWHPLYVAFISTSPRLYERYNYGEPPFSDGLGYQAVLADVRRRDDASSPIAYREGGKIWIYPMKNMGAYDRLMRGVFLRTVARHPGEFLLSLVRKLRAQAEMYAYDRPYQLRIGGYDPDKYALLLATAVLGAITCVAGRRIGVAPGGLTRLATPLAVTIPFALLTPLLIPSPLAASTLLYFALLLVSAVTILPVVALRMAVSDDRRRRHVSA